MSKSLLRFFPHAFLIFQIKTPFFMPPFIYGKALAHFVRFIDVRFR